MRLKSHFYDADPPPFQERALNARECVFYEALDILLTQVVDYPQGLKGV